MVIISPFASIVYSIYNHRIIERGKAGQPIIKLETKRAAIFEIDSLDCKRTKYGIFTSGDDTIIKYHSDSGDFILRKYPKLNPKVMQLIYWKNDCEYFFKVSYIDSIINLK